MSQLIFKDKKTLKRLNDLQGQVNSEWVELNSRTRQIYMGQMIFNNKKALHGPDDLQGQINSK